MPENILITFHLFDFIDKKVKIINNTTRLKSLRLMIQNQITLFTDYSFIYDGSAQKEICVLFIYGRDLSNVQFFEEIIFYFRKTRSKSFDKKDAEIIKNYHPLLTVGVEDVMTLYAEDEEEKKKSNKYLYKRNFDSRIKYFDSSIWQRYVPLIPKHNPFSTRFNQVFGDIINYYKQELYATKVARSSLEFQTRMSLNSFITSLEINGHDMYVTPFKFHSETQMSKKAEHIKKFFDERIGEKRIIEGIKWRALLVDDQATKPISSFENKCRVNKRDLIKSLLSELAFEIVEPKKEKKDEDIIKACIKKLEEEIYDIILLDYLLGFDNYNGKREYGHEFLKILEKDYYSKTPVYRRGPWGKYWFFPISSFPFAFEDKMRQLGVNSNTSIWHFSKGGDPITTPNLFRYNIFCYLKRQITEYYLGEEEMMHFVNKFSDVTTLSTWARALRNRINGMRLKKEFMENDQQYSKFATAMLDSNEIVKSDSFLTDLENVLEGLEEGKSSKEIDGLWDKYIKDKEGFNKTKDIIRQKIDSFKNKEVKVAISLIKENETKSFLDLSGKGLSYLPCQIKKCKNLRRLILKNNKLNDLPEELSSLTQLQKLDLRNNNFSEVPAVLKTLSTLTELDLRCNDEKLDLPIFSAMSDTEVKEMLNHNNDSPEMTILKKMSKETTEILHLTKNIYSLLSLSLIEPDKINYPYIFTLTPPKYETHHVKSDTSSVYHLQLFCNSDEGFHLAGPPIKVKVLKDWVKKLTPFYNKMLSFIKKNLHLLLPVASHLTEIYSDIKPDLEGTRDSIRILKPLNPGPSLRQYEPKEAGIHAMEVLKEILVKQKRDNPEKSWDKYLHKKVKEGKVIWVCNTHLTPPNPPDPNSDTESPPPNAQS